MRFRESTIEEMRDAFAVMSDTSKSPDDYYRETQTTLSRVRRSFEGGSAALDELIRRPGEPQQQWIMRQHYFENVNLVEIKVQEYATMLYGHEPVRRWYLESDPEGDDSKELDRAMNGLYESNQSAMIYREKVGVGLILDMASSLKFYEDEYFEEVRFTHRKRENVLFVPDPDDASVFLGVVEIVPRGTQDFVRWAWLMDRYGKIDSSWKWLPGSPEDNPKLGVIPYVLYGDPYGENHPCEDTVLQQRTATNLRSLVLLGVRSQTFATPVQAGKVRMQEIVDVMTGEKYLRATGPDGVVQLQGEGASFKYESAAYPVAEMKELETEWMKNWLGMNRVSPFAINASLAPEQPTSLITKLYPTQAERDRLINIVKYPEQSTMRLAARFLLDSRPDMLPGIEFDDIKVEVKFAESSLPSDRMGERAADAADVQRNLYPRRNYVKKWIAPDADDEEVDRILAELDADATAKANAMATAFAPPARVPQAPPSNGNGNPTIGEELMSRISNKEVPR